MTTTNLQAIAKWYSGKALTVLQTYVIPTLTEAETQGYWQKGASRKVQAALNKQTVAIKWARAHDMALENISDNRDQSWKATLRGGAIAMAMRFGQVAHAPAVAELLPKLHAHADEEERALLVKAAEWAADFAPVARLLKRLDATRPPPVIVLGSISPTVKANVGDLIGVAFETIAMPPVEEIWVEEIINGELCRWPEHVIRWPKGTRHFVSRFAGGTARNAQCHACGHAIKSGIWVPLVAQTAKGPVSLWVGRDCASKLFAVKVTGDAKFRGAPGSTDASSNK